MSSAAITRLRGLAAAALRPAPMLRVSDFADAHRVLLPETSKAPGPWKSSIVPYGVQPLDDLMHNSATQRVTLLWGSQLGKTEWATNYLAYIAAICPGPTMIIQPTADDVREYVQDRVEPAFGAIDMLRGKLTDSNDDDTSLASGRRNKVLHKRFPGGSFFFRGANSPAKLSSKPVRYLVCDETDRFPTLTAREGNVIDLAVVRTSTYGAMAKVLLTSTPTTADGYIWRSYTAPDCDQHRWWVPCPHCGDMIMPEWEDVRWPKGRPQEASIVCPSCQGHIHDRHKPVLNASGCWRPWIEDEPKRRATMRSVADALGINEPPARVTYAMTSHPLWVTAATPSRGKHKGYHLASISSPLGWVSLGDLASEWMSAQGDPQKLQVFCNTRLARVWSGVQGDTVQPSRLYSYLTTYTRPVPDPVAVLTMAVDVQGDRLEYLIAGWGVDSTPYHILHDDIPYGAQMSEAWPELLTVYQTPIDGMRIMALGVDCGYRQTDVLALTQAHWRQNVWALKGSKVFEDPVWPATRSYSHKHQRVFRTIGVSQAKLEVRDRLALDPGAPGAFVFPTDLPNKIEYFAQFTAEALVTLRGGRRQWEKTRERNEITDLWAMNTAVFKGLKIMGLDVVAAHAARHKAPQPPTQTAKANTGAHARDHARDHAMAIDQLFKNRSK